MGMYRKHSLCCVAVFVAAFSFSQWFGVLHKWSIIGAMTLIISSLLFGFFLLPIFVSNCLNYKNIFHVGFVFLKSIFGFALCTWLCGTMFLSFAPMLNRFILGMPIHRTGSFITDIASGFFLSGIGGLMFAWPFWLFGGLITQALWLGILSDKNSTRQGAQE